MSKLEFEEGSSHHQLAEQLASSKDPEKVLRKAAPKGKWGPLLWELAGAGLVSPREDQAGNDELSGLLAASAAEAPWQLVRASFEHLEERDFADDGVRKLSRNYARNAAAWNEVFEALPRVAQLTLALAKRRADEDAPTELVEAALTLLARAAVRERGSGHASAARDLGATEEGFLRRVAAALVEVDPADVPRDRLVAEALRFAPWSSLVAYLEKYPHADLEETLLAREDPALDVLALLAPHADGYGYVKVVVPLAARQALVLPESVDAHVVEALAAGVGDAGFIAGLGALPKERLRSIHRAAVEACEDESSKMAHALLLHLDDEESIAMADAALSRSIEQDELYAMVDALGQAGARGVAAFERALARFADEHTASAAKHRIELWRGLILASRHDRATLSASLLPRDDVKYLGSLRDLFVDDDQAKEILALLDDAGREQVLDAWASLDWNGQLGAEDYLGVEGVELDVESAPWSELRAALERTALSRVNTDAFERTDAPFAERTALAEELLSRDDADEHREVFQSIAYAVREELGLAQLEPDSPWDRVVRFVLRGKPSSSQLGWFEDLPAVAVRRWAAELAAEDDDELRTLAEEMLELVQTEDEDASDEEPPTSDTPSEDPIERVRRLAAAIDLPCDERIYALVARDEPDTTGCRTAAMPLGIAPGDRPTVGGEPMEHVITLDFDAMPELRARAGFGDDVAAVALFISSRAENEAFVADSGETAVVPLGRAELARGHEQGGASYEAVPLDVPASVFDARAADDDDALAELRHAVFQLDARALGRPKWLQPGDGRDAGFLAQFHDSFVPGLNCGDGDMYVFVDDAYWLS